MNHRLARVIAVPAMLGTWITGIALLLTTLPPGKWWHAKMIAVLLLTVLQMAYARWRRQLAQGITTLSPRQLRWINEIPTVLLFFILILVIFQPF